MQLSGWGATRASRVVIILLVVQHLGLSQVAAIAPATAVAPGLADRSLAVLELEAVCSLSFLPHQSLDASAAIRKRLPEAIPPDPVSLPRRLPRAPPAS